VFRDYAEAEQISRDDVKMWLIDLRLDSDPAKPLSGECKMTRNYLFNWLDRQANWVQILMIYAKSRGEKIGIAH
jgi:hypothetical protein